VPTPFVEIALDPVGGAVEEIDRNESNRRWSSLSPEWEHRHRLFVWLIGRTPRQHKPTLAS
jgi:hypothetical protein